MKSRKMVLIDGNGLAYRAFYAIPRLETSKGEPVNAIYGFITMMIRIIEELNPDYLACSFDKAPPTERINEYREYKMNRQTMPENLSIQIKQIEKVVEIFGIPVIWYPGFEADDCIGTMARKAEKEGFNVIIVSADKDFLQLVSENINIMMPLKGTSDMILFDESKVKEKFELTPGQIIDFKAVAGDPSDNIPGIKGIGEKSAKKLIIEFGSLENIYNNLEKLSEKQNKLIKSSMDIAFLSKNLATIRTDLPLQYEIADCIKKDPDNDKLKEYLSYFELKSIRKKMFPEEKDIISETPRNTHNYETVTSIDRLKELKRNELSQVEEISFFPVIEGEGIAQKLISFAVTARSKIFFVPVWNPGIYEDSEITSELIKKHIPELFKKIRIINCFEIKGWLRYCLIKKIFISSSVFYDLSIAAYLLNPQEQSSFFRLSSLCMKYLKRKVVDINDLFITGKVNNNEELAEATVDSVFSIKELSLILSDRIKSECLEKLLNEIELPLISVLAEMETHGIFVDTGILRNISLILKDRQEKLENEIFLASGEKFNINSPKQLADILYGKLGIPAKTKTKQGFSTNQEVLASLAFAFPIVRNVLEYKEVKKLLSTYVDLLPGMINSFTGRIHTSFNQKGTATGRISSSNPNLQNIPVKKQLGLLIRKAFRPEHKGYCFAGADYSQIELRILAHLSKDDVLINAFKNSKDIHAITAGEIFGVPVENVNVDMRRKAKEINFGIIYGMSAHGLAQRLFISRKEAEEYIYKYMDRFKGVKAFIENTISDATEKGYVTTLLGRKRWLPDINSKNINIKKAAERMAINAPVQGSAADLIKIAMIKVQKKLQELEFPGSLLLQVHDDLLFEVVEEKTKELCELVKGIMENAFLLAVPLRVNVKCGYDWSEMVPAEREFEKEAVGL